MKITVGEIRKALVALAGAAAVGISQGLIEGTAAKWVGIGLSILTAFGVYAVPNAQPASSTANVVAEAETVVKDVEKVVDPKAQSSTTTPSPTVPPTTPPVTPPTNPKPPAA